MVHSKRSLTTCWEHFRTVGFHLEKAGFLENWKRIIEDPKKTMPRNVLSQVNLVQMWQLSDEMSDMQVTCFRQTLSPSMNSLITAESISSCKVLFWQIFVVHLSAFSSSYMLVNASSWNVVKNCGNKTNKKSFRASSARVCSKASCGLASQINKQKNTELEIVGKKTNLRQGSRSPISFSSPTSVVDHKKMRNALLIMYLCIMHMQIVCSESHVWSGYGLIQRLTAHELILDRWTL